MLCELQSQSRQHWLELLLLCVTPHGPVPFMVLPCGLRPLLGSQQETILSPFGQSIEGLPPSPLLSSHEISLERNPNKM